MRWEVFGQQPPWTTAAQNIENRVQHFAHRPMAMVAGLGGRRQKGREDPLFLVAQIAAVAQMVAVMPHPGLGGPHRRVLEKVNFSSDSIDLSKFKGQRRVSKQMG